MLTMRRLALDVRPQFDAEQLVWDLLHADWDDTSDPRVWVESQLDMATNAHELLGVVILADAGSPTQIDRGLWRFPLSLNVMGDGLNRPDVVARDAFMKVMGWPFAPRHVSKAGHVSAILSFTGFQRVAEAKENGGKSITEYAADLVVEARDPQ